MHVKQLTNTQEGNGPAGRQLEASGFDVKVDRVGSAPLDQCQVTSVRNPQERTEIVRVDRRGDRDRFIPVVVRRTITVSLDCSNR
jgi:hypothetical protein